MEHIIKNGNKRFCFSPSNQKLLAIMLIALSILSTLLMLFVSVKLYTGFDKISNVTLKSKKEAYLEQTAQITLLLTNNSRYSVIYCDAYLIECKKNQKWERIEASYAPLSRSTCVTKELKPNSELELPILTSFPHGYLPAGEYRVLLPVDFKQNLRGKISEAYPLYAEFSIVESSINLPSIVRVP